MTIVSYGQLNRRSSHIHVEIQTQVSHPADECVIKYRASFFSGYVTPLFPAPAKDSQGFIVHPYTLSVRLFHTAFNESFQDYGST